MAVESEVSGRSGSRRRVATVLLVLALALGAGLPAGVLAGPGRGSGERLAAFRAAAQEFAVPEQLLLAVSFTLTGWEQNDGRPTIAGGYGPMGLTHLDGVTSADGRGRGERDTRAVPELHALDSAAALVRQSPAALRQDPTQNIRAGAALLASYARAADGSLPADLAGWYGAVMRYSQASDPDAAARFADRVYAAIRQGVAGTTEDGQAVVLTAAPATPAPAAAQSAPRRQPPSNVECPRELRASCSFVPAAYEQIDAYNYGNYDLGERDRRPPTVRYIVIHDIEGTADSAIATFQNPLYEVSAHYVIDTDGQITQMVATRDVAWHAGNWYINGHAIGIEIAGHAIDAQTGYSQAIYRATAKLVRYLADRYDIPLDRAHIIGHDDIPGPTSYYQPGMHWDPGPYFDWAALMRLLQDDDGRRQAPEHGRPRGAVTLQINPGATIQTVLDCEGSGAPITHAANFVYLHTAPSASAPYITNPYIGGDPLCANNWADKAVSGQSFYRFDTSTADWDGIYFGGQAAYFYNPGHDTFTVPARARLVRPAHGQALLTYGRAYPEAAAYPPDIYPASVVPLDYYSIPADQIYVAAGPFASDYFSAPGYTPDRAVNVDVVGQTMYYQIFYNHRFVFVPAEELVRAH